MANLLHDRTHSTAKTELAMCRFYTSLIRSIVSVTTVSRLYWILVSLSIRRRRGTVVVTPTSATVRSGQEKTIKPNKARISLRMEEWATLWSGSLIDDVNGVLSVSCRRSAVLLMMTMWISWSGWSVLKLICCLGTLHSRNLWRRLPPAATVVG